MTGPDATGHDATGHDATGHDAAGAGHDAAGQVPAGSPPHRAPDDLGQLQQEIEQTREQLGGTVEQLAAKADVKRLARAEATHLKDEATSLHARLRGKIGRALPPIDSISLACLTTAVTAFAVGSALLWRYGRGKPGAGTGM